MKILLQKHFVAYKIIPYQKSQQCIYHTIKVHNISVLTLFTSDYFQKSNMSLYPDELAYLLYT
jgi:hypothetical protein